MKKRNGSIRIAVLAGLVLVCVAVTALAVGPDPYHGQRLNRQGSGLVCDSDCDSGFECNADDNCGVDINQTRLITYTANTATLASGSTLAAQAATVATTLAVTGAGTFSSTVGVVAQTIGIDFAQFRIHDNLDALLPNATADADDLAIIMATPGTNATSLDSHDCGGLADTNFYSAFWLVVPADYVAGSTLTVRITGYVGAIPDQASTVDLLAWVPDYANGDGTVSSDLVTTAAQSIKASTDVTDYDFVVDDDVSGHVLAAGDTIQFKLHVLVDDDGNAAGDIAFHINQMKLLIST